MVGLTLRLGAILCSTAILSNASPLGQVPENFMRNQTLFTPEPKDLSETVERNEQIIGKAEPAKCSNSPEYSSDTILADGESACVDSRRYPKDYPPGKTDKWWFQTEDEDCTLEVKCDFIDIAGCKWNEKDYLEIRYSDKTRKYLCGKKVLPPTDVGNECRLLFTSDGKESGSGFKCIVTAVCKGTTTTTKNPEPTTTTTTPEPTTTTTTPEPTTTTTTPEPTTTTTTPEPTTTTTTPEPTTTTTTPEPTTTTTTPEPTTTTTTPEPTTTTTTPEPTTTTTTPEPTTTTTTPEPTTTTTTPEPTTTTTTPEPTTTTTTPEPTTTTTTPEPTTTETTPDSTSPTSEPWTSLSPTKPPGVIDCKCGIPNEGTRIVGGSAAKAHQLPWTVALVRRGAAFTDTPFCGGTIVNNQNIVSAAHCVEDFTEIQIQVLLKLHNYVSGVGDSIRRNVISIKRHLGYDPATLENDIAVLELSAPVTFTLYPEMKPICLPKAGQTFTGEIGVVAGWGDTSSGGSQPDMLHHVEVPILTDAECRSAYKNYAYYDHNICAGLLEDGGKDSCQGDSGGPMSVDKGGRHLFAGIVSWGEGCAKPGKPGVYTEVSDFIAWIHSQLTSGKFCWK